ncbi:MAG: polyphosphate:AMP phosphotransferase [Methylocystis sp.]
MFPSSQLPHMLSKGDFDLLETQLREKLLDAQYDLVKEKSAAILVLINGSDGAGKGEVINRLYEWLDDHFVETLCYAEPSEEERARPPAWRYWRDMPAKGRIGLVLGSWHHNILRARALGILDKVSYAAALDEINRNEQMLRLEGVHLLKIWLALDEDEARRRFKNKHKVINALKRPLVTEWAEIKGKKAAQRLNEAAQEMIELTSTGDAPWSVVPAKNPHYRDAAVGDLLLQTLINTASFPEGIRTPHVSSAPTSALPKPSLSARLDLTASINAETYVHALNDLQNRLNAATKSKKFSKKGLVILFEGNDAAGKGGAIRRVREALDPRRFRVIGVSAPTDEERARPYLWRFWRQIPRRGNVTIFDRSWYGRVLVERVEGFAVRDQWMRAYQEINDFERQLNEANYCVIKFWLAISPDEQLNRFRSREAEAYKRHKLTPEDWRNREKWPSYEEAMTDMIDRTSFNHAPWTLVEANDKKYARIKVLKTIVERLEV